jgi:transmembrane sensor
MQPIEDLINKFLNRECSPEEAEQVHQYFTRHPEILDKYLCEEEWLNLNHFTTPAEERSDRILGSILKQIDPQPAKKLFVLNNWMLGSIAAAICIFLTYLVMTDVPKQTDLATQAVVASSTTINWQNTTNNTRKTLYIRLDDGSKVALAPKAKIRYSIPFKNKFRDIYLTGEAKFYVAKDKKRPFTVYAGPLATTALGTVFKITAWPGSTHTKVHLLSGKVKVVQRLYNTSPVFLDPGKELVFDNIDRLVRVSSFTKPIVPITPGSTVVSGDTLRFVNQQLPVVIEKLQQAYRVHISAVPNLKKYSFTGEFNIRTESLDNALNTITSLNKLNYTLTDSTYIISKP